MIKRYNENWGSMKDIHDNSGREPIVIYSMAGDSLKFSIERALKIAKKENANVILDVDGIEIDVNPQSDVNKLIKDHNKKTSFIDFSRDYWADYWKQKSKDPDYEMDTIDDYAMRNSVSREHAQKYFKNNTTNKQSKKPVSNTFNDFLIATSKFVKGDTIYDYTYRMHGKVVDYNPNKEECYLIDFEDGTSVWLEEDGLTKSLNNSDKKNDLTPIIGLPSGEIIYMSHRQLTYFQVRNQVIYKNSYMKHVDQSLEKVKIEAYTFKDSDYFDITYKMNLLTW